MEQNGKHCAFRLPSAEACPRPAHEGYEYCLPHLEYLTEFNVETIVSEVILAELDVDVSKVKRNARFIDDLGADSLDITEMVMIFEVAFGFEIESEDQELIQSVGEAITYLTKRLREEEPSPKFITRPHINLAAIRRSVESNPRNVRRLLEEIGQSSLFRDYTSRLGLNAARVMEVFDLVIRNNWIDQVTTVPEFDKGTRKLASVNYLILCRKVLYNFRLTTRAVGFTSYSLAELRLSYQINYSAGGEISEVTVTGGLRNGREADEESFTFETREGSRWALTFLEKCLTNMEALR